jgi:hypothetical protein
MTILTYQQSVVVETTVIETEVDVVVDVVTKNNFGSLHEKITVTKMQIQGYFILQIL